MKGDERKVCEEQKCAKKHIKEKMLKGRTERYMVAAKRKERVLTGWPLRRKGKKQKPRVGQGLFENNGFKR